MVLAVRASAKVTPTSTATSRSIVVPSGVVAGDLILVFADQAAGGATTTTSMTGGSGYTAYDRIAATGHSSYIWTKENAQPSDGGSTLTFTHTSALRVSLFVVVISGAVTSGGVQPPIQTPGAATNNRVTSSDVAPASVGLVMFAPVTGNGASLTAINSTGAGTKILESIDPTSAGASSGAVFVQTGPIAQGTNIGGYTISAVITDGAVSVISAWLIPIAIASGATTPTTVRPNSTVSSTGLTNVGGAASINAALADDDDTTYAETGDNPNGTALTVGFPTVADGAITVTTRGAASAASPVITRKVDLLQGTTVIASRTYTLTTTPATQSFTTSTAETNAITDRTQLRLRFTDTAATS